MTTAKDKEIIARMREQNIPAYCWSHTLEGEGQLELHTWIEEGEYMDDMAGGVDDAFFYPNRVENAGYARLIANLIGKEMVLTGDNAFVVSLTIIGRGMKDSTTVPEDMLNHMDNASVLIVTGFYEHGAEFPYTGWHAARIREYLLQRLYKVNQNLILLSDKPPMECTDWWPVGFLSEIADNSSVKMLTPPPPKVVPIRGGKK